MKYKHTFGIIHNLEGIHLEHDCSVTQNNHAYLLTYSSTPSNGEADFLYEDEGRYVTYPCNGRKNPCMGYLLHPG